MSLKKIGVALLGLCVLFNSTIAFAEEPETIEAFTTQGENGVGIKITGANSDKFFSNFDTAWQAVVYDKKVKIEQMTYPQNDQIQFKYLLNDGYRFTFYKDQTVTKDLTITSEESKKDRGVEFQLANSRSWSADGQTPLSHSFKGSITIENGGSLSFVPGVLNGTFPAVTVEFAKPITVKEGGTLNIENINPSINNGGNDLSSADTFKLADSATGPLVDVASGGSATLEGVTLESSGTQPAIKSAGEVVLQDNVHNLTITSTGSAPAIELSDGAELTLKDSDIASPYEKVITSSTEGVPAISVDSGAKLVIPHADTANISSTSNDDKAVELAGGATIQIGETSVTTASNSSSDANYLNNRGITVLSAGARMGSESTPMKAAVMLDDGTVVQGNDNDAPTVKDDGSVSIPAGGSVTKPGEETVVMEAGGTLTSTGDTIANAESVKLDRSSVSLYSNTDNNTVQLTATVTPESLTDKLEWSSSNNSVATVDKTGLVTAHSNGTAEITASVGATTATCTVTVSTYTYTGDYNYPVTIGKTEHGTVTIAKEDQWANDGEKITVTVTPDDAYMLDELVIKDKTGNELQVKDNGDGTYTFTMPEGAVTITATFVEDPDWVEPEPNQNQNQAPMSPTSLTT